MAYVLPNISEDWFTLAYSVGPDERLARLSASVDVQQRLVSWREAGVEWEDGLAQLVAESTKTRIECFDGNGSINTLVFPFETLRPRFDQLPDGRWVVANTRCWVDETNARILAADGSLISRICLGDGIAHLQCDRMGGIWVSYFDEGVLGNFGWGDDGHPAPIGVEGIMRFNADGHVSWHPGHSRFLDILDCYAMNVASDGVWLYYYTDFPIVHVSFDGHLRRWSNNEIGGASVVAVDGDRAILLGGYENEVGTGALLELEPTGTTRVLNRFDLGARASALGNGQAFARGSRVHFVCDGIWTVTTVQEFADGLSKTPPEYPPYVPGELKEQPGEGDWSLDPER